MEALHSLVGREGGDISALQMSARAVLIFAYGLLLVRLAGKRVFGKWGAIDIILSMIIGSNLSRALTGSAPLWPTLAATTVLVLLHWVLTALAVRIPALGPVLKGRPARIIKNGEADAAALKRQGVGAHDLEEALRREGLSDVGGVSEGWVERSGAISLVKR